MENYATIERRTGWHSESESVEEGDYVVRNGDGKNRNVGIFSVYGMVTGSDGSNGTKRYFVEPVVMEDVETFDAFVNRKVQKCESRSPVRDFIDVTP